MPLSDQQIRALLVACHETQSHELNCEEFLAAMAGYAEARAEGRELAPALAAVAAHERLCINCREELRALVQILTGDPPKQRTADA